ncbi:MAG: CDP-glucose 4,6-dehydratase [Candidatus Nanopelagicales bacterium]|nr:CDP-glucose 4,6-dehydratase [Candidatus Nanopelagicales bacterium]
MADRLAWEGRSVLLTGHTGFKGTWLACMLKSRRAQIHGFALDPETDSLFSTGAFDELLTSDVRADVADVDRVAAAVSEARPEVVFHLAAQPLVRESYKDPLVTMRTNVLGTVNVLEAVRNTACVKAVVIVTTDKVYRDAGSVDGYREGDPLGGHDPYSASKAAADIITDSYRLSFARPGLAVATARAGNVLGGGDAARDRLVPDLIRAFRNSRSAQVRNPHSVRPWQHVLDPLTGYLVLAENLLTGRSQGAWNFAPRQEDQSPVATVASKLAELWGEGASWAPATGEQPHETKALTLDATRASRELNWHPRLRLDDALSWTVRWWRSVDAGTNALDATLGQVEDYERLGSG